MKSFSWELSLESYFKLLHKSSFLKIGLHGRSNRFQTNQKKENQFTDHQFIISIFSISSLPSITAYERVSGR